MLRLGGLVLRPLVAINARQNVNYMQNISKVPQRRCLSQRPDTFAGPGASIAGKEEKVTPLGWFLLVSILIFGAGTKKKKHIKHS